MPKNTSILADRAIADHCPAVSVARIGSMRHATTLLLVVTALEASSAVAQTVPSLKASVPHITVSGYASADVVPDEAALSLGIQSERPDGPAASAEMAAAAAAVVAECKRNGIDPVDIKTTMINLTMLYDDEHTPSGRLVRHTLRGYRASERLTIRIRDVTKAGSLARLLIEKGANQFNGIGFTYSKEQEKRRELHAAAMRDALAEAQSYTDAIGLELGRVIQIGDDAPVGSGEADLALRASAPAAQAVSSIAIPVEPGVETISTSINVTWELKDRRK